MAYKGIDLDLRSPRAAAPARETLVSTPGSAPAEWAANGARAQPAGAAAGPIAVDDTVLACCNCAFDVARFHASPDVRLEHLLHALTRVGAAVEVLAELGIRVDALRRDTAVAIAAEIPAGSLEGDGMPRASAAFEDVLRRAGDQAARQRAPAGLHDLLRTILGGGPGSPAAALLMRAAADLQRLERWRDAPLRVALNSTATEARTEAAPGQFVPGAAEALLTRLDHMEAAMRALQAQVAADRLALGDLLRDVQSGLQALRSEGALAAVADRAQAADRQALGDLLRNLQSSLKTLRGEGAPAATADRVQAVEALLEAKLGDLGKAVGALDARFTGVDKLAAASDTWPDTWQELHTHLQAVEGRVGTQTLDVANRIADAFSERLAQTEAGLQHLQEETERHWNSNDERQIALEASVRAHLQGAEEAGKKHERDLAEVYQALVKLGANQQTLGDNFTAWRIETGGDIGIVSNGLQKLEQEMLDLLGHLGAELQALRQESNAGGRRNGFKRWLYGTGNVFAAGWREDLPPDRQVPGRPPKEDAPDAKVEIVAKS